MSSVTNEDTECSTQTQSHKGCKLYTTIYTLKFKLEAVKYAESNSNHAAARKYGVDVKRIPECKNSSKPMNEFR